MNIMYANISGGLIFAGSVYGEMLFRKVSLESYIAYFETKQIDVLSLSEVHLEGKHKSEMTERIAEALGMPYSAAMSLSPSFLDTGKQIGMSVISRYPITGQEEFIIPSPKIEVDRPNGEHWVMLDKGGQRVYLDIDGKKVAIVNFSYFPFHHFNRRVDEPEFKDVRMQLLDVLLVDPSVPTIVTGDFNCKGFKITDAFKELFEDTKLKQAVKVSSTVVGADDQLDHILYQPHYFSAKDGFAELNDSDHLAIGATLQYK